MSKRNFTPIIITVIILIIIIYVVINTKQKTVECANTYNFDYVSITEDVTATFSSSKINNIILIKKIELDNKYADSEHLNYIKNTLKKTLSYLSDVDYEIEDNYIKVTINATNNEILLLNNLEFICNDDLILKIDSNTKSNNIITFKVGDNYTESEFMTKLKNNGYFCK